jgi:hypothetical protein
MEAELLSSRSCHETQRHSFQQLTNLDNSPRQQAIDFIFSTAAAPDFPGPPACSLLRAFLTKESLLSLFTVQESAFKRVTWPCLPSSRSSPRSTAASASVQPQAAHDLIRRIFPSALLSSRLTGDYHQIRS